MSMFNTKFIYLYIIKKRNTRHETDMPGSIKFCQRGFQNDKGFCFLYVFYGVLFFWGGGGVSEAPKTTKRGQLLAYH